MKSNRLMGFPCRAGFVLIHSCHRNLGKILDVGLISTHPIKQKVCFYADGVT